MKRASLSQEKFVAMLLAQGAVIPCGCCKKPIENPKNIRREHLNALEISGDDSVKNMQLWHLHPCAHAKTYGGPATTLGSDAHAIAKMRRMEGERLGTAPQKPKRQWPSRPIQSRGFQKAPEGYNPWKRTVQERTDPNAN